jgi:hypothetical protein
MVLAAGPAVACSDRADDPYRQANQQHGGNTNGEDQEREGVGDGENLAGGTDRRDQASESTTETGSGGRDGANGRRHPWDLASE